MLTMLLACHALPHGNYQPGPPDPVETPETGAPDTATTGSPSPTGTTGDTGPDACAVLPPVPAPFTSMDFETGEDFDFDKDGYLCSTGGFDAGSLACKNQAGDFKIVAVDVTDFATGTRELSNGNWAINDVSSGSLKLIDTATGGSSPLATGFSNANGLESDFDGYLYVADLSQGLIRQVDPNTGEQWMVAEGLTAPNGITLSPDTNTLYSCSFGGNVVYAIDRIDVHEWDTPRHLIEHSGAFDGIEVDTCGNVYVTDSSLGKVFRFTPDGQQADLLVQLPEFWIPNLKWGTGVGGWNETSLYVTARYRVFEVEMGITGKRHVSLP